jgi:sigma-B regulation protein RsbU (phosphoserine phosphatase)
VVTEAAASGAATTAPEPADASDLLAFLARVSDTMIRTLDTGESADQLARLVVPRLADWATVTVLGDDGGPERTGRAHRDPARLPDLDTYLAGRRSGARDRPALMAALLSGEPVQLTTLEPTLTGPEALPSLPVRHAVQRLAPSSVVFVPLRTHGEVIGALSLVNSGNRPPHTEQEIAAAVEVAHRGALALDNARLYGRQRKVAETLQRSLLTPPPQSADLRIAARYRPASRHTLVGGDFYDAFAQADGATLLVVGDVAGHSVEATAAMSELRSTVRALAYDQPASPAATLVRTDRVLTGLRFGTLATVLVARIEQPVAPDQGSRTLRWSSAGHPPPILMRSDGRTEVLEAAPERLVGTGEPAVRTDHVTDLDPGDTLVLYTDGLLEHQRTGIDAGLRRLTAVLADLAGRPVEDLCDEVLQRVVCGPADDDVALLVVRCG